MTYDECRLAQEKPLVVVLELVQEDEIVSDWGPFIVLSDTHGAVNYEKKSLQRDVNKIRSFSLHLKMAEKGRFKIP